MTHPAAVIRGSGFQLETKLDFETLKLKVNVKLATFDYKIGPFCTIFLSFCLQRVRKGASWIGKGWLTNWIIKGTYFFIMFAPKSESRWGGDPQKRSHPSLGLERNLDVFALMPLCVSDTIRILIKTLAKAWNLNEKIGEKEKAAIDVPFDSQ